MKSKIQIILSITFIMVMLGSIGAFAQSPQKFNYQGIARDVKGNPLSNQQMALKLSILPTADATMAEYEETQLVTTNEFGLYTLQIGNGSAVSGEMKNVKWETGNKYIKVAIDPKGGTDYVDAGTTQLLSVPYAIYADKAGVAKEAGQTNGGTRAGGVVTAPATTGDLNMVAKFNGTPNTVTNSIIYDNGTNVGIGTTTPATALHVRKTTATYLTVQADANNSTAAIRLQDLNGTGGELGISKFGDNIAGNFMGVSRKRMGVLNNLQGPFVVNAGGYMFFGQTVGVNQINRLMIDSATGNVGIGTTVANQPTQKLDVNGQIRMRGGAPGAGKLMTSAADGTASWSDAASAGLISGLGNINTVPKFTPDGSTLGNSMITDDGNEVRIGSFPSIGSTVNLGGTATVDTPSLSFATNSSGQLGGIFLNNAGQLQFVPNTSVPAFGTPTFTLDDDGGGATFTDNVTVGGSAAIGNVVAPVSTLHVSSPSTKDTGIYANCSSGSTLQIPIYGHQNNFGFGTGVAGVGFGGTPFNVPLVDCGVYGSSSGIGVWSNGMLRVSDGSQVPGNVLVCTSATGNSTWSGAVGFSASGYNTAINTGAGPIIIYPTEDYDDGGDNYDPLTGVFTAPLDGLYTFSYTHTFPSAGAGATGHLHGSLQVNGVAAGARFVNAAPNTSGFWNIQNTVNVKLVAGDQVRVFLQNNSSVNLPANSANGFSGFRVR